MEPHHADVRCCLLFLLRPSVPWHLRRALRSPPKPNASRFRRWPQRFSRLIRRRTLQTRTATPTRPTPHLLAL